MAKRIDEFAVLVNKRLNEDLFILEVEAVNKLPEVLPGQFVQIRIDGAENTFLRRPVSVHDVDYEKNSYTFLVQIAGNGTEKLSRLNPGEMLNIVHPLGNSFTLPSADERILLAGGGCGVAPLLFLGKYLKNQGYSPEILLGFRNRRRITELEEYQAVGPVYLTTEDGSLGEKGYITGHSVLAKEHFDKIFCCGPDAMMKAVASYCTANDTECEVSLENLMACGFGVCLCCVVDTKKGNLCTCTEGPVFNIKELKW